MGTRASLAVWVYRHGDGMPSGVAGDIRTVQSLARDGTLNARAGEAAAWLVVVGSGRAYHALEGGRSWQQGRADALREDEAHGIGPQRRMGLLASAWTPTGGPAPDASWLHVLEVEQRKPGDTDLVAWTSWKVCGGRGEIPGPEPSRIWEEVVAGRLPPDYREGGRTKEGEARIGWTDGEE